MTIGKLATRKITINISGISQIKCNHHILLLWMYKNLLVVVFCLDQLLPSSLISKTCLIRLNVAKKSMFDSSTCKNIHQVPTCEITWIRNVPPTFAEKEAFSPCRNTASMTLQTALELSSLKSYGKN